MLELFVPLVQGHREQLARLGLLQQFFQNASRRFLLQLFLLAGLQGLNAESSSVLTFWRVEKQREGEVATP